MKAIIQRVLSASVTVDNTVISSIGRGILVFAAVAPGDTLTDVESLANKILRLKLWDSNGGGRWKKSVMDMDYQVLLVSQFTLLATIKKWGKPDFHGACSPTLAKDIYTSLLQKTRELYFREKPLAQESWDEKVQDGVFGAMMQVALVNDGPVTFEVTTTAKDKEATPDDINTGNRVQGKPTKEDRKVQRVRKVETEN